MRSASRTHRGIVELASGFRVRCRSVPRGDSGSASREGEPSGTTVTGRCEDERKLRMASGAGERETEARG